MTRFVALSTLPGLFALAGSSVSASASASASVSASATTSPSGPHGEGCLPVVVDELRTLQGRLDRLALDGRAGQGQYWYVDRERCKVVVAVLRDPAPDAVTRTFLDTAVPGLLEIVEIDAPVKPRVGHTSAPAPTSAARQGKATLHGGSAIYSSTHGTALVCTSGFNNYRPDSATTAGHCAADSRTWYAADNTALGRVSTYRFPDADWAVLPRPPGMTLPNDIVNGTAFTPITRFAVPRLDQHVCGTGAASGTQCGTITATDVTVNYATGAVTGLARSTQSGSGGDSGGPVFAGNTGVALISGGPDSGAPTFLQPLNF